MPTKQGLLANLMSWVFSISFAIFDDETTTVCAKPKRNDMRGPWSLASCHKRRCREELLRRCRLPMIGRGVGPGGRGGVVEVFLLLCLWMMKRRKIDSSERRTR